MFSHKKEYYLIIESTKDINLSNKKKVSKFNIIYRNKKENENIEDLHRFRRVCKEKRINFFVSNNIKLASTLKADGIYISAFNKDLRINRFKTSKYKITVMLRMVYFFSYVPNLIFCEAKVFMVNRIHKYLI